MAFQDHSISPTPPFPDYPQMIMGAIEALNEKEGASREEITKHIESNYADLPPTHATHVTHTIEKLKQTGQLMMLKDDTYKATGPDDDDDEEEDDNDEDEQPIKRGRGRPPKPKGAVLESAQQLPSRPRGRPPKPRDLLAPVTRPNKPPPSGRPRGRPKKNPSEVTVSGGGAAFTGGVKRGRGRPRKS